MTEEEIAQIYRDMELELISSMKRNLSRHLKEEDKTGFKFTQWQSETLKEMKRFQRENKSIIRDYTKGFDKEIQKILQDELKQGSKKEFKRYKKVLGDKFKESDNLRESFFKINDRKIKSLIKSVNNDLGSANTACFRMINDQYRRTVVKAVMFSNHGVVSPKKAIDMATKEFLNTGINCIEYKNGRRVNIASYSQMAVRTANTRAQLIGEGQFREQLGEHLVKITSHGGTCKLCSKWEGKILIDDVYSGGSKKDGKYPLLSTAMEQGLFHPNCRHGLPTYYPELDGIEFDEDGPTEETLKQYQEDLNYINQNIYRFQRLEAGSLDEDNIQKYSILREKWENKKTLFTDNSLTYDERYAINTYIGAESYNINEKLRLNLNLTKEDKTFVNNLDNALNKMENYDGTVKRSIWIDSDDIDYFLKDFKEGKDINLKSYVSTTKGKIYNPEARVQMKIKSKTGKNITKYNEAEQEILFRRNTKFKVIKIDTTDDYFIKIYMEEK